MKTTLTKANEFFATHHISGFSVVSGSLTCWRCRAKLAVRQIKGEVEIGLFQEGSHDLVPLHACPDHHPKINEAIEEIKKFFLAEQITGYNEKMHSGEVRYLQFVVERRSGRVQVSFVLNIPYGTLWENRLQRLYTKNGLWHSFWVNVQPLPTNTIFGKEWHLVIGEKYVWESIAGYEVPFLPSHFGQANLEMFERLLHDLVEIFPRGERVAELFSGIGIISTILRPVCDSVILYEIEPSAKESFSVLLKQLPEGLQTGCEFIVGNADTAHEVCGQVSTIIVDPPRKGLSKCFVEKIVQQKNIHFLLYISCCWKTFERDAQALLQGGFSVKWTRSYLFFPGTNHLETMCLFSRTDAQMSECLSLTPSAECFSNDS